jgi:ribonuclease D
VDILVARTSEEIEHAFNVLSTSRALGCDTETSGFTSKQSRLFSVQFSDGEFNVLVPTSEGVPLGVLADILADGSITKIFHNAKFDLEFLHGNGYPTANVFDTMIAEKVLTRGAQQSASLAETLYRYFAVDLDKSQRAKFGPRWNGVWTEALVDYALSDVCHLPRLMEEQTAWMGRLGMLNDFQQQMRKMLDDAEARA